MAVAFWLLVLGAGVVTGQPWAWLILAVLLICVGLARMDAPHRPVARPRPAKPVPRPKPTAAKIPQGLVYPMPAPPAPIVRDPWNEARRLKRQWQKEDHKAWDEDFNRLLATVPPSADGPPDPRSVT